jgi:hypothetical protein
MAASVCVPPRERNGWRGRINVTTSVTNESLTELIVQGPARPPGRGGVFRRDDRAGTPGAGQQTVKVPFIPAAAWPGTVHWYW